MSSLWNTFQHEHFYFKISTNLRITIRPVCHCTNTDFSLDSSVGTAVDLSLLAGEGCVCCHNICLKCQPVTSAQKESLLVSQRKAGYGQSLKSRTMMNRAMHTTHPSAWIPSIYGRLWRGKSKMSNESVHSDVPGDHWNGRSQTVILRGSGATGSCSLLTLLSSPWPISGLSLQAAPSPERSTTRSLTCWPLSCAYLNCDSRAGTLFSTAFSSRAQMVQHVASTPLSLIHI